jgi:hypothetical protein
LESFDGKVSVDEGFGLVTLDFSRVFLVSPEVGGLQEWPSERAQVREVRGENRQGRVCVAIGEDERDLPSR